MSVERDNRYKILSSIPPQKSYLVELVVVIAIGDSSVFYEAGVGDVECIGFHFMNATASSAREL